MSNSRPRGPNPAREGIIFGPQDNIQLSLDLALRYIANTAATVFQLFNVGFIGNNLKAILVPESICAKITFRYVFELTLTT